MNPPDGANDEDLEIFNEFYTNVHMPEVAERRHALRAVRYELLREVRPPYQGAPRFLAVYEVDEAGASNGGTRGPPYTSGPEVWQRHTTPWRLWYRRLGGTVTDAPASPRPAKGEATGSAARKARRWSPRVAVAVCVLLTAVVVAVWSGAGSARSPSVGACLRNFGQSQPSLPLGPVR